MSAPLPAPDFLGIGVQKAGTTWLYGSLRAHPDAWLPPVKELHYFGKARRHKLPLHPRYYNGVWRRQFGERLAKRRAESDWKGVGWDLRYFFAPRSDAWYASLFRGAEGRLSGDITPRYGTLSDPEVAEIHALLPAARVLLFLRDPIDRAWSSARMASDRRGLALEDPERLWKHLATQRRKRGDYLHTLHTWKRHYGPGQLFVGFYEDIVERPVELIERVCTFLGLDPEKAPGADIVERRFNESRKASLPPELERRLAELYLDDLETLEAELGSHARAWRERAERALEGAPAG